MDAVVGERDQPVLVDRVPQAQLGGDAAVEPLQDRQAVAALRRGGEPEELAWLHVLQEGPVRRGGRVVELVHDDHVEVTGLQVREAAGGEALDGREDVLEPARPRAAGPQLAERPVAQRVTEGEPALLQDLLTMGDEQEARAGQLVTKAHVVEGRHDRLPGPGRGHQEVAVVPVLAGDRDLLEEPLLERLGADLDRAERQDAAALVDARSLHELVVVEGHEVACVPVRLEDHRDLRDHRRVARRRDAYVPLEAGLLRGVRQVRRADVRGVEAGPAVEQPRLGVVPLAGRVVGDTDFRAEAVQFVQRADVGRAGEGRGQDAHLAAGIAVPPQALDERGDAAPGDERHEDVDAVGRPDLGADLVADPGLSWRVRQQRRVEQRDERVRDRLGAPVRQAREDRAEELGARQRALIGELGHLQLLDDDVDEPTGERRSATGALLLGERLDGPLDHAREVKPEPIGGLRGAERTPLGVEAVAQPGELHLERIGDQLLAEAAFGDGHDGSL